MRYINSRFTYLLTYLLDFPAEAGTHLDPPNPPPEKDERLSWLSLAGYKMVPARRRSPIQELIGYIVD